jgi:hypothetical protein
MVHKKKFPLAILAVSAGIEIFRLIRRRIPEARGLSVWQHVLAEKYGELAKHVLMRAYAQWWIILSVLAVAIAGNFVVPILGGILAVFWVLFRIEWLRSKDAKGSIRQYARIAGEICLGVCIPVYHRVGDDRLLVRCGFYLIKLIE